MVFADGILLLSATISDLQTMEDLCSKLTGSKNVKSRTNSNAENPKQNLLYIARTKGTGNPL